MNAEEKFQMDAILEVFRDYIDGQDYFDIAYSKKAGYIWFHVEQPEVEEVVFLSDARDLLNRLFAAISSDVRSLQICGEHIAIGLYPEEIRETRRRVMAILDKADRELRSRCTSALEHYLEHCNDIYD